MRRIPFVYFPLSRLLLRVVVAVCFELAFGAHLPSVAKPPPQAAKEVKVVNGDDMPVPVVALDTPILEPFHDESQINVSGFLHEALYTIPAGQRAVIETVTVLVELPVRQAVGGFLSIETTLGGAPVNHYLVLTTQGTVLSSETRTANHAVKLYADAGSQIFLNGAIQAGSTIFVSMSGYLEEIP